MRSILCTRTAGTDGKMNLQIINYGLMGGKNVWKTKNQVCFIQATDLEKWVHAEIIS